MYLKIGNEYADSELQLLSELLSTLDEKLREIHELMANSTDSESDGLCDRGEYLIGVGFSVIQQYITDTLTLTGIRKDRALDIGLRYSNNHSFVSIVNAAANWWKHSAEWMGKPVQSHQAKKTQEIVNDVIDTDGYPLSNVLAKLQGTSTIMLSALLPNLILWRSAVDTERKNMNIYPLIASLI